MTAFFGKYRGSVVTNIDPNRMGRLQVSCPQVLGQGTLSWAMPCVPFAGNGEGFYMLPAANANVWIEFEAGDPDRPIWTGCFWTREQLPSNAALPTVRTIKTGSAELTLDDTPGAGAVTLSIGPPAVNMPCTIKLSASGIEITMGSSTIKLDGARVNVNEGALEVI